MKRQLFFGILAIPFIIESCHQEEYAPIKTLDDDEFVIQLGGTSGTTDQSEYAFSYQIKGLNDQQSLTFYVGNSLFNQNWVEAPSSTTARDGLGPLYNAQSCAACHFRDGRGKPITGNGILFRLGTTLDNSSDPMYGGQLQDNAISVVSKEGTMGISYTEISGTYPDGTAYSLRKPTYAVLGNNYGALNGNIGISPRVGQQMIGLGLIENIPESQILANVDEFDGDNNGISGKANYSLAVETGLVQLGRFGWKANVSSLLHQISGALNGDIGITSTLFPNENNTLNQTTCVGLANGGTPEIEETSLSALLLYCRSLAVPNRRNTHQQSVKIGAQLFKKIDCILCHTNGYTTSNNSELTGLNNQKIYPFSDFLLHDMGSDLADNVPDHLATGNEWRTQPLWGLGLIQKVNNHIYLLHDGRARSIEEAILWHGGEAEHSKNQFKTLSKQNRTFLLEYLNSL